MTMSSWRRTLPTYFTMSSMPCTRSTRFAVHGEWQIWILWIVEKRVGFLKSPLHECRERSHKAVSLYIIFKIWVFFWSEVSGIAELANEGAKESGVLTSDAHKGICSDSKFVLGTDKATFQRAASCFLCVDEWFLLNLRPIYELACLFWLHVRCYGQCMRHVLPLPLCF